MAELKQIHYNIDNINKENALFNLIFGEKSNGKSYQVKHKEAIYNYINNHKRFIILRRWKSDITNLWIEKYFSDIDIEKITEGKYNTITVYRKEVFFANVDDKMKVTRGEKIGYIIALSGEQHFSGASFLDVDRIIFEEFMERGVYISKEPSKLMTFYSTIDRKEGRTKLYMVGNTISRVCPYLQEWNLQDTIREMKQGDIRTINIDNDGTKFKMAIEYCKSSGGKKLAIGNAKGMIDSGAWQSEPQPKLDKSKKLYNTLYRIGFDYSGFRFIGELIEDKQNLIWFIYPYHNEFSNNILVFSDKIKEERNWQRDIYNISINNNRIKKILDTFRENNIFYSDDLTGTDFKQAIDFNIKR